MKKKCTSMQIHMQTKKLFVGIFNFYFQNRQTLDKKFFLFSFKTSQIFKNPNLAYFCSATYTKGFQFKVSIKKFLTKILQPWKMH